MIARCVNEKKTLVATYNSDVLKLADCVGRRRAVRLHQA